jgi:hypothetical protein
MQESGGGKNEWGHDPTIFIGGGDFGQPVTEESYTAYKALRDSTGQSQGVGPCQLTWKGYQDQADALGGCWRPLPNMVVGFGIIAGYRADGLTWHETWRHYNAGSLPPPAGETYADEMDARYIAWQGILNPA